MPHQGSPFIQLDEPSDYTRGLEKDEKEHSRHTGRARTANRLPREKSLAHQREKKKKGKKKKENKKEEKKRVFTSRHNSLKCYKYLLGLEMPWVLEKGNFFPRTTAEL